MDGIGQSLLAFGLFPGLVFMVVVTLLVAAIARIHTPGGGLTRGIIATLSGRGSAALLLAALAPLAIGPWLPWPAQPRAWGQSDLWLAWSVLEAAHLVALIPALSNPGPLGARAAIREAQIAACGRTLVWIALGIAVWAGPTWRPETIAAHSLALLAALAALPAALGWGGFADSGDISPGGAEGGLSRAAAELAAWGRATRGAALLTLVPLLGVPRLPGLPDWANVAIVLAAVLALAGWGRMINGNSVRLPLLEALRWCWVRAVPLVALAIAALYAGRWWL